MWKIFDIIASIFGLSEHGRHGCLQPLVAMILLAVALGIGLMIGKLIGMQP